MREKTIRSADEARVSLFLAGDTILHESVYLDARNEDGTYDFDRQLHWIREKAQPYDLRYYNQETILGGDARGLSGYPRFNSPRAFGEYMVQTGFNLVSTANNHALDMDFPGIRSSLSFWERQPGVLTHGTFTDPKQARIPVSVTVNGIRIGFVSYTESTNLLPLTYGFELNCFPGNEEQLLEDVRKSKSVNDCVIAAMHWGEEYSSCESAEERRLSERLISAGADLIIGCHPHVIQPFDWIRKRPVFFSLGNLLSAHEENQGNEIGMIAALDIVKTGDELRFEHIRAELTYNFAEGRFPALRRNIQVIPFSQITEEILPGYRKIEEEKRRILRKYSDQITVGTLSL